MIKAIYASEDAAATREKTLQVIEKLRALRSSRAAELAEATSGETLSYYGFPEEHWRRIRTNNPLERILREIRRRTRVVGAFTDGQSALNLAAIRLRHVAGTAWSTKRYLNVELLKDQQMRVPSPLKPASGAAQPKSTCEKLLTLPKGVLTISRGRTSSRTGDAFPLLRGSHIQGGHSRAPGAL
jgi:hypothetical protein